MLNQMLNVYNEHTTKIVFASGAILGLLIGLLIGWVIWPTSFYNTTPESLRSDMRDDILVLIAEDFAQTGNLEQARIRLGYGNWKKEDPAEALQSLAESRPQDAAALQALAQALEAPPPEPPPDEEPGEEPTTFLQRWSLVFQLCGGALIVAALGGGVYLLISRMGRGPSEVTGRATASQAVVEPIAWEEEALPVAQFKTSYTLGDDFYDPSFSIEKENGDFMGECGVGISETIGVGDPKKVTALEAWLFDKNDIRTVTQVLMSEYALQDEALHAKLAAKGELVPARPGAELVLETATLVLRARVVDLEYGEGQLPPNSFFQRVTMELGIWAKPEAETATMPDMAVPPPP